jgi:hypothetical protein
MAETGLLMISECPRGGKSLTRQVHSLELRQLVREGCLAGDGEAGTAYWTRLGANPIATRVCVRPDRLVVDGSSLGAGTLVVGIAWTSCNYGSRRPWFLCPQCQRRCAILYRVRSIACRLCHDLRYLSQRETTYWRGRRRAYTLLDRIGQLLHPLSPPEPWRPPRKPHGMSWRTFARLLEQAVEHEDRAIGSATGLMKEVHRRLAARWYGNGHGPRSSNAAFQKQ